MGMKRRGFLSFLLGVPAAAAASTVIEKKNDVFPKGLLKDDARAIIRHGIEEARHYTPTDYSVMTTMGAYSYSSAMPSYIYQSIQMRK